jgi:60 kDa SS-A/Ro ribonucleoprotein
VDRIVVFSDSQDCDWPGKQTPAPFGNYNYIVDVSAHSRGINYDGLWTAEISGWSEHFLAYIAALEGLSLPEQEQL